jgi:hypothetical protein
VTLVESLRQRKRAAGREAEAAVRFPLEAGQIEQQRGELRGSLALLGDRSFPAAACSDDCLRRRCIPQPLRPTLGVVVLPELRVEPAPAVFPCLRQETRAHFPVFARAEIPDPFLALDQYREGRRLHAADGRLEESAFARSIVECGHRARAVDADEPVGLRAALRGVCERQQLAVGAQAREPIADRTLSHRLQPEPPHGLAGIRMLQDVAEDQLPLAAGIAGIDEAGHVLAPDELDQQLEPRFGLLDRREVEARRNDGEMLERPAAGAGVVFFGSAQFEQMPYGRREDVIRALEVIAVPLETAERARDIRRDRWFLRDDELFAQARIRSRQKSAR